MMDAEIKKAWLAALRSGDYAQAQEKLRDPDGSGYCCLGVLLDVAITEQFLPDLELEWWGDQVSYESREHREAEEECGGKYCGSTTDGQLGGILCAAFHISGAIEGVLIEMNDFGDDFLDIADYIEGVL